MNMNDVIFILLCWLLVDLPNSLSLHNTQYDNNSSHHYHHHHHHYHQLITRHICNHVQQDDLVLYIPFVLTHITCRLNARVLPDNKNTKANKTSTVHIPLTSIPADLEIGLPNPVDVKFNIYNQHALDNREEDYSPEDKPTNQERMQLMRIAQDVLPEVLITGVSNKDDLKLIRRFR